MTNVDRYPAQVFWSDEDSGFIAVASDLPGCSAFGETQQEALVELQDAIAAWIEAAEAAGNPIPEPSRPALETKYSGKMLLRMPRALHARLANAAKFEDVSLNQYIVFLLASATTTISATSVRPLPIQVAGVSSVLNHFRAFYVDAFSMHTATTGLAVPFSGELAAPYSAFPAIIAAPLALTSRRET